MQIEQREFEINMGYSLQNLKNTVYDLQNKHESALLDLKKCQISIESLFRSVNDLGG